MVELQPDVLVFDVIDERLSVCRIGPTWFTVSNYLAQTALGVRALAEPEETLTAIDPRRPALFAAAVRALAGRLRRELPRTTFVLHEARFVTRTRAASP